DVDALERGLNEFVARHEMLRAVFSPTGARVTAGQPVRVSTVDSVGATLAERETHTLALACAEVERPFDLEHGPLLRATVIRLGAEDRVLVLVAEHLVFDGMSYAV